MADTPPLTPNPALLAAAASDRDARPWRYYKFTEAELKAGLDARVDTIAQLQADLAAAREERDREKARTDVVIAEFDAPWPHTHTVGEVVSGSLAWQIHKARAAVEEAREQAEARLIALQAQGYVQHDLGCDGQKALPCTCGLTALLTEGETP